MKQYTRRIDDGFNARLTIATRTRLHSLYSLLKKRLGKVAVMLDRGPNLSRDRTRDVRQSSNSNQIAQFARGLGA